MSLPDPDGFDPTPFDVPDDEDDGAGETAIVRDADGEDANLCIDPEVIQGFSEWKDPASPPPWEAEGQAAVDAAEGG